MKTKADPPAAIEDRETRRAALRTARDLKMARSAHAYVRGSTAQFYAWLAESKAAASAPKGPPVWICGDCHVGNLGPIAGADGQVNVQIRDLDQTVIGDPAHDLIRLGLSLATAARSSDLPGVVTARMLEAMVEGYSRGLERAGRDHDPNAKEPVVVKTVRRKALVRDWRHLAEERIEDVTPVIPLGKRFWPLTGGEREDIDQLMSEDVVKDLVLALAHRHDKADVKVVDAAYWKKGCSSLGTLRFAVLMRITEPGGKRLHALLDAKEAVRSVAPVADGADMPSDNAVRVVSGARALSPNLGDRMLAERLLGKPMVLRELLPQDLKIELEQFGREQAVTAARYLAEVVGHAHGRQMDKPARDAWRATMARRRKGALDAPSWLWSTVVDLAASHEAGYLEHCRRYALEAA